MNCKDWRLPGFCNKKETSSDVNEDELSFFVFFPLRVGLGFGDLKLELGVILTGVDVRFELMLVPCGSEVSEWILRFDCCEPPLYFSMVREEGIELRLSESEMEWEVKNMYRLYTF